MSAMGSFFFFFLSTFSLTSNLGKTSNKFNKHKLSFLILHFKCMAYILIIYADIYNDFALHMFETQYVLNHLKAVLVQLVIWENSLKTSMYFCK